MEKINVSCQSNQSKECPRGPHQPGLQHPPYNSSITRYSGSSSPSQEDFITAWGCRVRRLTWLNSQYGKKNCTFKWFSFNMFNLIIKQNLISKLKNDIYILSCSFKLDHWLFTINKFMSHEYKIIPISDRNSASSSITVRSFHSQIHLVLEPSPQPPLKKGGRCFWHSRSKL